LMKFLTRVNSIRLRSLIEKRVSLNRGIPMIDPG